MTLSTAAVYAAVYQAVTSGMRAAVATRTLRPGLDLGKLIMIPVAAIALLVDLPPLSAAATRTALPRPFGGSMPF